MKTVTAYTQLINYFSKYFKFKNKIKIKIITLKVLFKIMHSFKCIFIIIHFKMSFVNFALHSYLITVLKLS